MKSQNFLEGCRPKPPVVCTKLLRGFVFPRFARPHQFLGGSAAPKKRFQKAKEAIWLTVINEILKFPPQIEPFFKRTFCLNLLEATKII